MTDGKRTSKTHQKSIRFTQFIVIVHLIHHGQIPLKENTTLPKLLVHIITWPVAALKQTHVSTKNMTICQLIVKTTTHHFHPFSATNQRNQTNNNTSSSNKRSSNKSSSNSSSNNSSNNNSSNNNSNSNSNNNNNNSNSNSNSNNTNNTNNKQQTTKNNEQRTNNKQTNKPTDQQITTAVVFFPHPPGPHGVRRHPSVHKMVSPLAPHLPRNHRCTANATGAKPESWPNQERQPGCRTGERGVWPPWFWEFLMFFRWSWHSRSLRKVSWKMVDTFWMIVKQVRLATKLLNTCERCFHPWHPKPPISPSQVLPYPPRRVGLNLPSSMNHPLLVFCPSIPCLTKEIHT